MKVTVGMSGGVDSAAAAAILKQEYETDGLTLRLWCGNLQKQEVEENDAREVCAKLGIKHRVLDLTQRFSDSVIERFIEEYRLGRTPNPCIVCNREIKFGEMLKYAKSCGSDKIATGHYARVEKCGDKFLLKKAVDVSKDQSYVLYTLTQEQLSNLVLPLGDYTKKQIREIAADMGFNVARKSDSQDICFVPDGDYASFIEDRTGIRFPKGEYVNLSGDVLGEHNGIIRYTVGQRKGLGIALGKPSYVLQKDIQNNRVVLGDEEHLFYKYVNIDDVNIIAASSLDGVRAQCKLRYAHTPQPCIIHQTQTNKITVEFDAPQRAPAPGQAAVFYDGEILLGGGTITKGMKTL